MAGIYGLSGSGLDVDAIVKNLMKAQSARYDTITQKKTQLEWKKSAFNTFYTSINEFRNTTVWNNTLQSNLKNKSAVSSNLSVAKVSANADAVNINHVMKVSQLASGATTTSSANITTGKSKDSMAQQFGLSKTSFELKLNGKTIAVNTSESINSLVSRINQADAGVKATYDANMDRFFLYSTETGSAATIDFTGTNATGLSFLANNLKLGSVAEVDNGGVKSNFDIWYGIDIAGKLAGDGSDVTLDKLGYSAPFNLKIKHDDGVNTTEASISIDPTKDTMATLVERINKTGYAIAEYSYNGTGVSFSVKAVNGSLDLSDNDSGAIDFFTNSLGLDLASSNAIDDTGVTSSTGDIWTGINISNRLIGDGTDLTLDKMGYSGWFNLQIKDGNDTANITVDTRTDTILTLMDKINAAGVNATADYSYAAGPGGIFSLQATNGSSLDLSGSDSAAIDFLYRKLKMPIVQAPEVVKGTDARFTLDGAELTQSSNNFRIAGVNYELMGTGTISVNVSTDTAKIVENVKSFIEAYNTELGKLNAALSETKYKDFLPLTDEQKSALSESDSKAWEEKAKSGLFRRNPILLDAVTKMRNDIISPIQSLPGKYTSASSIGITTGDYLEGGKLYLDEEKLQKALEEDPDIVYKIFGVDGSETTHAQKGLAGRLYDTLKDVSDKIAAEAGATVSSETKSNLYKQISTYEDRMKEWKTRLQATEASYYKKYNALEVALNNLTQQSSWLDSLFASNS